MRTESATRRPVFTRRSSLHQVRLVEWQVLINNGFSDTLAYRRVEADVRTGVEKIVWPVGNDRFVINSDTGRGRGRGNGVKPIKDAFVEYLKTRGWITEQDRFDAHLTFHGSTLPFAIEWETGNISSSHRAINRLALAMLVSRISGGILVVPSGDLYRYLTDRVGNYRELEVYFPLWREWRFLESFGYLAVVAVQHDEANSNVPRIQKGTDGRALL